MMLWIFINKKKLASDILLLSLIWQWINISCVFSTLIINSILLLQRNQIPPEKPSWGIAIKFGKIDSKFKCITFIGHGFYNSMNIQIIFENKVFYLAVEAFFTNTSYILAKNLHGSLVQTYTLGIFALATRYNEDPIWSHCPLPKVLHTKLVVLYVSIATTIIGNKRKHHRPKYH